MNARSHSTTSERPRWLFSAPVDLPLFLGSALLATAVVGLGRAAGVRGDAPVPIWLLFVVCVDVAHVWATVYRVYLDGDEVKRRPLLSVGAPVIAFALSVAAHAVSAAFFWRCLAYVAVWHFIRQQTGWMLLYGRRAGDDARTIRFDALVIWSTTLAPVIWWHAHLPRAFWWFKEHDFVAGLPTWCGAAAVTVHGLVLASWLVWTFARARTHGVPIGKLALLAATWITWVGGIVLAEDDFAFTVMNVTLHGVPYLGLLWRYAKGRSADPGAAVIKSVVRWGVPAFVTSLLLLAFGEELLWDNLVWHDHARVFGDWGLDLSDGLLVYVVPLLSLPQTTHYVLDGFVWTSRTNPFLSERLGWR
jgi:hypothetical protein